MEKPVLIRFVGMAPSTAIESEIHAQVAYLAPLCADATGWHVTVERQGAQQHPGELLCVRVDVSLPDRDLGVARTDAHDAQAALRQAMDAMRAELLQACPPGRPAASGRAANPLTAGDICTRTVVFTDRGMMLAEAARLMHAQHVGSLVVVEERSPQVRIVVGMVTDRDIAISVAALERDPHAFRVGDIMSPEVVTVREADSVLDVLAVMRRKRVRRVPVTGAAGELIGLVALDDVLTIVAEQMQALGAAGGAAQSHEVASGS